jgi:hypothetical protein
MTMLFDPLGLDTPIAGFNGGLCVTRDLMLLEQKTVPVDVAAGRSILFAGMASCLGLPRE